MVDNFGPGVSRVLDPTASNIVQVVWQQGKPPLDSELNLLQQISAEWTRLHVLRGTPSGWYGDAINPQDSFVTNPNWSNWFQFGPQLAGEGHSVMWAVVNGWLIPVTGTLTGNPPGSPNNADTWNRMALPPPPSNTGDARIDYAFLEVWLARVPPNPATTNKPSASAIWRYGNVESGYSFLTDDLQDPSIGFETTQRLQLQYRIRLVSGVVGLASYPDGFDPSVVKGQGAAATATSYVFENMRDELGDPGLWRAGDGTQNALGSVDGYSYAIPLCAVFRRNSVAWDGGVGQNLNGAVNRNPTAVDRTGYKTFATSPTLASTLSAGAMTLQLTSAANIPLPLTPASPVAIQIGDEILLYSAITGTTVTISSRGAFGTAAEAHPSGSAVKILAGRPDGLFSDQITKTDILDLRHIVSAGFDYQGLLKGNLDRMLQGNLRATWKRSGGGPQGPFVFYQDKIAASSGALGVTKLDAPDGIRQVFGDPAMLQPVIIPISSPGSLTNAAVPIGGTLGNSYTVTVNHPSGTGFLTTNVITIPKSQFTTSLPGSDVDQVSFIADQTYVKIRFMGETSDLALGQYSLSLNGSGDLLITLTGSFSARDLGAIITLYLQYGAGRGLSRRPDAVHSVAYLSGSPNILLQQQGMPADNQNLRTTWAMLWSKFRSSTYNSVLPSTSEAYVDPGSKTVVLTPFRLMPFSQTQGTSSNFRTIQKASGATSGAMPANTPGGDPKWTTTDPLNLFSGYTDPTSTRANMVVILPRRLMPGWGEVQVPILYSDSGNIDQGINFGIFAPKGTVGAGVSNYVPMSNGSVSYAIFSTLNLNTDTSIAYNTSFTFGAPIAGMRFFTDARGLSRQGLELPPFYGIARLFAVYEAQDYKANGSAFDPVTREPKTSGSFSTNLLRQNFNGPTFWIESDTDGDPTFILNAEALDLTKSPNTIANFAAGNYVIEASIFGADRGAFSLSTDCRIVLTRARSEGVTSGVALSLPQFILPGPPEIGDEIAINYSREPYQGDAWGSQMAQSDIGYKPGALTTSVRYQLSTTDLTYNGLTRPNQKVLEVLAGMSFVTTLGTGRLSGDVPSSNDDFRNVGYEPWSLPASPTDPRPTLTPAALSTNERTLPVGSQYLGLTERLPLGALFRDKDFRGNAIGGGTNATSDSRQLVMGPWASPGTFASSIAPQDNPEYDALPVHVSIASGNAGEIVVHVDGEPGNYNVLTNFRTNRGGSAFTAYNYSGGDIGGVLPPSQDAGTSGGILSGLALLVRNLPTAVGATEVSAGSELMMLVVTTARAQGATRTNNVVQISTSGTGEGYSAADLYRIAGHPLVNDSARSVIDPDDITLARESDFIS